MPYNISGISSNTTGLLTLVQGVNNELMFGTMGILILIVATAISYMSFIIASGDTGKSMAASSFIAVTFAIILRITGLVSNLTIFIVIIFCAGTMAIANKLEV